MTAEQRSAEQTDDAHETTQLMHPDQHRSTDTASTTVEPPADSAAANTLVPGETIIEDSVIAKLAGIAAREVPGVYDLGGSAARVMGAIRDALNTTDHSQGVTVEVTGRQVTVNLTIVVEYPTPMAQVAEAVRQRVDQVMRELADMSFAEVNITVNDVHRPNPDAQPDYEEASSHSDDAG